MYELNGDQFSYEELQSIAEAKGYTIDELFNKNPEIKKLEEKTSEGGKTTPPTATMGQLAEEKEFGPSVFPLATSSWDSSFLKTDNPITYEAENNKEVEIVSAQYAFESAKNIYSALPKGEDEDKISINANTTLNKLVENDDFFKSFPLEVLKNNKDSVNSFIKDIKEKYDLTKEADFEKANKELNDYYNNLVQDAAARSETYNQRLNSYKAAASQAAGGDFKILQDKLSLEEKNKAKNLDAVKTAATVDMISAAPFSFLNVLPDNVAANLYKTAAATIPSSFSSANTMNQGLKVSAIKKQMELIKNSKSEDQLYRTFSQEQAGASTVSGALYGKPTLTKEEKLNELKDLSLKAEKDFIESVVKTEDWKKILEAFPSDAQFLDNSGVFDKENILELQKAIGTQGAQMLGAMASFGLTTYTQEGGGAALEILNIEAAKYIKEPGEPLDKAKARLEQMPVKEKSELFLKLLENGQVNLEEAVGVGARNAGLDLVSNFFVVGKAAKVLPKSVLRNLLKGKVKQAIVKGGLQGGKELGQATLAEVVTENLQELSSAAGVGAATGEYDITFNRFLETTIQTALTTPFLGGATKVTSSTINEVATKIAALDNPAHVRSLANSFKANIESQYKTGEISFEQKDELFSQIEEAEKINKSPIYKGLGKEAKVEAFNLALDSKRNEAEVKNIQSRIDELKSNNQNTLLDEIKLANAQKRLDESKKIEAKLVYYNRYSNSGKKFADVVNNTNEGSLKDLEIKFFSNTKESKNYADNLLFENEFIKGEDKQALERFSKGETSAVFIGNTALINDVATKTNIYKEVSDFNISTASNVAHHEALHFLTNKLNDTELDNLVKTVKNEMNESDSKEMISLNNLANTRVQASYSGRNKRIQNEEYLTSLSDFSNVFSLLQGENKVQAGFTLDKIANIFNKQISTLSPELSANFDAIQLLDFIKKYNKIGDKDFKSLRIPIVKSKSVETDKDVETEKQTNVAESRPIPTLDDLYKKYGNDQVNLVSNSLLITPDGKETFDFSKSEFGQSIGGLVEKITKANFDGIAPDARKGITRNDYKNDLISLAATLVSNEYVPSKQAIGKFMMSRLRLRALALAKQMGIESTVEKGGMGIGFAAEDQKDLMATETSESEVLKSEEIAKEKPVKKKETLLEKIKFPNETMSQFDEALVKGIALNIKKFDTAKGQNQTISPFVADLKMDLANYLEKDLVKAIKSQGLEEFLRNNREAVLDNFTTTFLSKHPFFRKGILKRVNGVWTPPRKISAYKYDWVDDNGNKLKIDRDNAAGRGLTSGPEFIKRNPDIKNVIKENEFIDYHFQDGALRNKAKQNPIASMARQIASEMGFDVLKNDLANKGELTTEIFKRADLHDIIVVEETLDDLSKDLDRGLIKESKYLKSLTETEVGILSDNLSSFTKKLINNGYNTEKAFKEVYTIKVLPLGKEKLDGVISELDEKLRYVLNNEEIRSKIAVQEYLNYEIHETISEFRGINAVARVLDHEISTKNNAEGVQKAIKNFIPVLKDIVSKEPNPAEFVIKHLSRPFSHGKTDSIFSSNKDIFDNLIKPITTKEEIQNIDLIRGKFVFVEKIVEKGKEKIQYTQIKPMESFYYGTAASFKEFIRSEGLNKEKALESKKVTDKVATESKKAFIKIIKALKDAVADKNNPMDIVDAALIFRTLYSDQKALIKKMYPFEGIFVGKNTSGEIHVYEHNPPVSYLARHAIAYIAGDLTDIKVVEDIINRSRAYLTPRPMDETMTENGHKQTVPKGKTGIEKRIAIEGYELITVKEDKVVESKKLEAMSTTFNKMLERKKGIAATETISKATAKLQGQKKGRFKVFVPASADDFVGLLYNFLGTGKQGDADMQFFEDKLLTPLAEANSDLNSERQAIKQKWQGVVKANKGITKILRKENDYKFYTNDHAVRTWMWDKLGYEIPGISETDKSSLIESVNSNEKLLKFAKDLINIPDKKESWLKPDQDWTAGTVEMDLQEILSKIGRARIFEKFITNADIIFSEGNLNKIEAAYGPSLRSALEDMLYRIKNGRAREIGNNKLANAYLNWVRGSVATTMFFNTRTSLLQQLSIVNFTNWNENNPMAQAKFLLGSPRIYAQYWTQIFNSDWMKERRQGLKTDINESELVARLEGSKNKNKALLSYILEKGFSLTKYGDNIAIATGGAPYLYNREQKYIKDGLTVEKAREKAFLDFQELAERTQQSSRQDLLSNQQVSITGRLFLAFQNTTMQMTRIQKKSALDIINRRGDFKTNISRFVYYSAIQNTLFAFFQNTLFAAIWADEDDEDLKIDDKTLRAANTILDSALRGSGIGGAVLATLKNAIIAWKKQNDKGWTADNSKVLIELLNVSPAVGIKVRKINTAMNTYKYNKKIIDDISYTNPNHPYYGIVGSLSSAIINVPLDRVITKAQNLQAMTQQDAEAWQRTALFLGYNSWDLGLKNEEIELAKAKSKFKSSTSKNKVVKKKVKKKKRKIN